MSDTDHLVVLCTCPRSDVAERLGMALIEARLAACVNIVPGITSVYPWEGKVQRDQEVLMLIKTTRGRYGAVQDALLENHPYELPEIIAVPIDTGLGDYLKWVSDTTSPS